MAVFADACKQRDSHFSYMLSSGADGRVSGSVEYDVFGKVVTETGVFAGSAGGSCGISALVFAYAGKPYDSVTGLSDYGFRDYAPSLARFTTVDPIRDGSNWYAYCNSDPVNYVDAWGLKTNEPRSSDRILDLSTSGTQNPYRTYKPFGINLESGQTLDVSMTYQKNSNDTLSVTVRTKNKDGTYDYSNGKIYTKTYENVTNRVLTPEERGKPVDYYGQYYYFPNQFPSNTPENPVWHVTKVTVSNDLDKFGPIKIWTDAHCTVTTYNKDGTGITGTAEDYGYLFHTGKSPTTWGCGNLGSDEDAIELGTALFNVSARGTKPTIYVYD